MEYFNYAVAIIIIIAASIWGIAYTFNHVNPWAAYGIAVVGAMLLINCLYQIFKPKTKK